MAHNESAYSHKDTNPELTGCYTPKAGRNNPNLLGCSGLYIR